MKKFMKGFNSFFLIAIFIFVFNSGNLLAQISTIDTSTIQSATSSNGQRKTVYDSTNGLHWSFYSNGSELEYSFSSDGLSWTSAGTLPYTSQNFSVIEKVISSIPYVFLSIEANSNDVVLRRGILGATTIAFDSEINIFDGASSEDLYKSPTLAISENNHLWVSSIRDYGDSTPSIFRFTLVAHQT